MAKPTTLSFGKFVILLETATPGTYAAPCGFTDKSLEIKANTSEQNLPDCDDPDAPGWTERGVTALSASVSGQGVLALEASDTWRDWMLSGVSKNVRVQFNVNLASNGGYFQGAAVMTSFKVDGALGDKAKVSVQIDNDGEWTWTDAAS